MPPNPAIDAFTRSIISEKLWGEILIKRSASGFMLCHVLDRDCSSDQLKPISLPEVRKIATFTAAGQFRPLRAAPNLPRGWLFVCNGTSELGRALQEFYPGSVSDWFAVKNGAAPTSYREFTGRQSGMYRITQLLNDMQAGNVTRAACHPRFCLKQRLWTVPGFEADSSSAKSEIPCLEPCAVLLEFARKASRIEQEGKFSVQLSRSELDSVCAALESAVQSGVSAGKIGDVAAPTNPRRLQLLLEKFKDEPGQAGNAANETEP